MIGRWHEMVIALKKLAYGSRGEPISYGEHRLRYVPGTRPVRLRYRDSTDVVVRNDALQLAFLLDAVPRGAFVCDIGGNVGQYAVFFASLVGDTGHVVTFEPDPGHRAILQQNIRLNRFEERTRVEPVALSDSDGIQTFFSRGDAMSSLRRAGLGTNGEAPDVRTIEVATTTLDAYLDAHGLPTPDLVKVDVEGAEINILKAAPRVMRGCPLIICELHPYAWREFGTSFEEFLALVEAAGRTMRYLDPHVDIAAWPVHGSVVIS